jgi:hypothetical protein
VQEVAYPDATTPHSVRFSPLFVRLSHYPPAPAILKNAGLFGISGGNLYTYYGNQPLHLHVFPIWWAPVNAIGVYVSAIAPVLAAPHLRGWRPGLCRKERKESSRFLKKAAPKTFVSFYTGCRTGNSQKFLGRLFSKRRILALPYFPWF